MVAECVDIAEEFYFSILLDRHARSYLALCSTPGGVDIETLADDHPTALARLPIDPLIGIDDATAQRIVTSAGFDAEIAQKVAAVLPKLWRAFYESDGTLVEINPWCARRPTRSSPSTRKPRSTA